MNRSTRKKYHLCLSDKGFGKKKVKYVMNLTFFKDTARLHKNTISLCDY